MAKKTWWAAACDLNPDYTVWSVDVTDNRQMKLLDNYIPTEAVGTPEEDFMLLCFLALEAGEEIPELWLVDGEVYAVKEQDHCIGCAFFENRKRPCNFQLPCIPSWYLDGCNVIFVRVEEA